MQSGPNTLLTISLVKTPPNRGTSTKLSVLRKSIYTGEVD